MIDECTELQNPCSGEAVCLDFVDGYTCACDSESPESNVYNNCDGECFWFQILRGVSNMVVIIMQLEVIDMQ